MNHYTHEESRVLIGCDSISSQAHRSKNKQEFIPLSQHRTRIAVAIENKPLQAITP
jgi:hypothetical protein